MHELDYSASELEDDLPNTQPTEGSDWTAEEKAKFRSDIFHCGINQSAISKAMNKCINSLMTCYSNLFKMSTLKTVVAEERAEKHSVSEHHGMNARGICVNGMGANPHGVHAATACSNTGGAWLCHDCVNYSFLQARDKLIRVDDTCGKQFWRRRAI